MSALFFFLKYLNLLPDYLEHINKNAYICTVKTNQGHEAAAPNKAAYFVPRCKEILRQPRGRVETPPKAFIIPDWALTARSAALFIYLSKHN